MVKELTTLRKLLRGKGMMDIEDIPKEPETVMDLLDNRFSQGYFEIIKWSKQHFDVNYDRFTTNVFSQYIRYLDEPKWTKTVLIPAEVVSDFAYKPGLVARVIYGSNVLQYLIYAFNDIREPYDLTEEFLAKRGIKCLNRAGIEKLNELIEYKQAEENKRINTFKIEER
jgi:hypothetical protein